MRRYLLALDRDLVTADEHSSPEPPKKSGNIRPRPCRSMPSPGPEHRMNSAVLQLEQAGCHAVGVITGQRQLDAAVRAEIHGHVYDEGIAVTGRRSPRPARLLRLEPVHRLRLRLGHRLTVFPLGAAAPRRQPVS